MIPSLSESSLAQCRQVSWISESGCGRTTVTGSASHSHTVPGLGVTLRLTVLVCPPARDRVSQRGRSNDVGTCPMTNDCDDEL